MYFWATVVLGCSILSAVVLVIMGKVLLFSSIYYCHIVLLTQCSSDGLWDSAAQRLAEDEGRPEQDLLLAHPDRPDTVHKANWGEHGGIGELFLSLFLIPSLAHFG